MYNILSILSTLKLTKWQHIKFDNWILTIIIILPMYVKPTQHNKSNQHNTADMCTQKLMKCNHTRGVTLASHHVKCQSRNIKQPCLSHPHNTANPPKSRTNTNTPQLQHIVGPRTYLSTLNISSTPDLPPHHSLTTTPYLLLLQARSMCSMSAMPFCASSKSSLSILSRRLSTAW